jgi:hypothetical protein
VVGVSSATRHSALETMFLAQVSLSVGGVKQGGTQHARGLLHAQVLDTRLAQSACSMVALLFDKCPLFSPGASPGQHTHMHMHMHAHTTDYMHMHMHMHQHSLAAATKNSMVFQVAPCAPPVGPRTTVSCVT